MELEIKSVIGTADQEQDQAEQERKTAFYQALKPLTIEYRGFLTDKGEWSRWYNFLKIYKPDVLTQAVAEHIRTNPHPPQIADIGKVCERIIKEQANSTGIAPIKQTFTITTEYRIELENSYGSILVRDRLSAMPFNNGWVCVNDGTETSSEVADYIKTMFE